MMILRHLLRGLNGFHVNDFLTRVFLTLSLALVFAAPYPARAETPGGNSLQSYLAHLRPADLFPNADAFGAPEGSPPIVPVFAGKEKLGYAFVTTDFTRSIGYSGKPISTVVGLTPQGIVKSVRLVGHSEPIVLIGIPEKDVVAAMNALIGKDMSLVAKGTDKPPQTDMVSGATVTMLVIGDSVSRASIMLLRSGRFGGTAVVAAAPQVKRSLVGGEGVIESWQALLGDGSVRHLHLSVGEVSKAFKEAGQPVAAEHAEDPDPETAFIDLYAAQVSIPTIGRSLLGEAAYQHMLGRLKPGQQAILVAGKGAYSFKGSGYVRGGIFDRVEVLQDGETTRFHDYNHTRIPEIAAEGAPDFPEIALFTIPEGSDFSAAEPWDLQLLVQRPIGMRDKAFISFGLTYALPEAFVQTEQVAPVATAAPAPGVAPSQSTASQPAMSQATNQLAAADGDGLGEPLWKQVWRNNVGNVAVTIVGLLVLTGIFFFQNQLVAYPLVFRIVRRGFLLFTIVWIGWILRAQLSIVNVLAYFNSLMHGFSWDYFLVEPQIFILWLAVAAALLFWGRGPFCGWLCPVGAVQEFVSIAAKALKIPQIKVPWSLHERLWPIKYIVFLSLFGLSMYSLAEAEKYAEIEPFRTFFLLRFAREWPFVIYALTLLSIGLFIERFFCRYICPLGAALAIPGRLRMFDWLRRWKECGSPCHLCANECPVQAIHPEGNINVNECIYCMNCQELYWDEKRCPHMIQAKVRRDKMQAMASPSLQARKGSVSTPVGNAPTVDA